MLIKDTKNSFPLYCCIVIFLFAFWGYYFLLQAQGAAVFWPATYQGDYFSIDWSILDKQLWSSLWYYHVQLPFYLLYVYLFERVLAPPEGFAAYYILHTMAGLAMVYSLYYLMTRMQGKPWLAASLIILYTITPSFYLNYSQGWHDFFTSCLITFSAYLFYRAHSEKRFRDYFFFFMLLALIGNVRALYHPFLFFLPVILLVLLTSEQGYKSYKKILLAALLPALLILFPYVKNYYLFGAFNVSTHSGRIMVQTTYEFNMHTADKIKYVKAGKLSDLVFCIKKEEDHYAYYNGKLYDEKYCNTVVLPKYSKPYMEQYPQYKNVPILMTPGSNYLGNIGINEENTKNAFKSILLNPKEIPSAMREKWRILFKPNVTYFFGNMRNVRHLPNWLSFNLLNSWPGHHNVLGQYGNLERRASLFLVIILPLLVIFAFSESLVVNNKLRFNLIVLVSILSTTIGYFYWKGCPFSAWEEGTVEYKIIENTGIVFLVIMMSAFVLSWREQGSKLFSIIKQSKNSTLLYMVFVILYTSIMTTILVGVEHQRYRQYIDPLFLILFALYITKFKDLIFKNRI